MSLIYSFEKIVIDLVVLREVNKVLITTGKLHTFCDA